MDELTANPREHTQPFETEVAHATGPAQGLGDVRAGLSPRQLLVQANRYSHGQVAAQLLDQIYAAAIGGVVFAILRLFQERRRARKQDINSPTS